MSDTNDKPQEASEATAPAPAPVQVQQNQGLDQRRRLRELLSIPESQRSDPVWDEIIELEIQLAPGNRVGSVQGKSGHERQGGPKPGGGATGGSNNWKRQGGPGRKHPKAGGGGGGGGKKPPSGPPVAG